MSSTRRSGRISRSEIKRAEDTAQHIRRVLSSPAELDHSLRTLAVLANSLQQSMEKFSVDWIDTPTDQLQALCNMGTNLAAAANDARDQIILALGTVVEYRLESLVRHEGSDPQIEALSEYVTIALNHVAEDAVTAQQRARGDGLRNDEQPRNTNTGTNNSAGDAETPIDAEAAVVRPSVIQTLSEVALQRLELDDIWPDLNAADALVQDDSTPGNAAPQSEAAIDDVRDAHDALLHDEPVVANRRTGIYHPAGSPLISRISGLNRIAFVSPEAAEVSGFRRSKSGFKTKADN